MIRASEMDVLLHGSCSPLTRKKIDAKVKQTLPLQSQGRDGDVSQMAALAASMQGIQELHDDPESLSVLLDSVAVNDPSLYMSSILHYVLCGGTLSQLGSGEQNSHHLADLNKGRSKGVFLITEMGTAGSLMATKTQAVYEPRQREFVLSTPSPDAIKFSSVSPRGGPCIAVVFARLICGDEDQGVYPFVVRLTDEQGPRPGVEIGSPIHISTLPLHYGLIQFRKVRIPYGNWLGSPAVISDTGEFHDHRDPVDRLARSVAAGGEPLCALLPSSMAAIARTSSVLALRHSYYRPLGSKQHTRKTVLSTRTQQSSLFSALAEAFALTCAAQHAHHGHFSYSTKGKNGSDGSYTPLKTDTSVYKAICTDSATRIIRECRERSGIHGLFDINRIMSYQGLAEAFVTAGGDNKLIYSDVGMSLARSIHPLKEKPVPEDARSLGWWSSICLNHRNRSIRLLREKLRRNKEEDVMDYSHKVGVAHGYYLVAHAVENIVSSIRDPLLRIPLTTLSALHGTSQAHRLSGDLMSSGVMSPHTARSLDESITSLCQEIATSLPLLFDLSGFPEISTESLGAENYVHALTSEMTWEKGEPE